MYLDICIFINIWPVKPFEAVPVIKADTNTNKIEMENIE